jgi:Fe-S oxidoreductase
MNPTGHALLPDGGGWLLVELAGETREEAAEKARVLMERLERGASPPRMRLFDDPAEADEIWEVRESGLGATARVPKEPDAWPGWEDAAVPPERVGAYLREFRGLLDRHDLDAALYGHFGDGCIHCRITFDLKTAAGIAHYRAFVEEAADLVLRHGGSLSGEHGDGQARGELLGRMFGDELVQAFREFKAIWDPDWKMNPGKVVDPDPMDANLRLGTSYAPWTPRTEFAYPKDEFSFPRAALRCVGVGKCRRTDAGTMCPSYMATREEIHSTRGRARILFEMLQGDVITDGWRSEEVKEALDLCLACKGCKSDCPVNVDMATYKAEFFSHYWAGRLRPPAAYAMGLIMVWARAASLLPAAANLVARTEPFAALAKRLGGIAPARTLPAFAPQTFRSFMARRPKPNPDAEPVILWADTFNNYFHPATAVAAVEVLEAAGYRVVVPRRRLCCGRPLYDFGFLGLAKRFLRQTVEHLRELIRWGVPVIGLEPSCTAVFRDELPELFPHDEDALRLSQQTFTLGEFIGKRLERLGGHRLERRAVVHGHCHHKAIMGLEGEQAILDALGLEYQLLDSGCCGMAGSFGFEHDKYEVSVACGERVLLPAARRAAHEDLVITDGFSCREQVEQLAGRTPLHTAQVLQMALREGPRGPARGRPEDAPYLQFQPRRAAGRGDT